MSSKYQYFVEQLQDPNYNPFGTIQFYINGNSGSNIINNLLSDSKDLCFAMTGDFSVSASAEWAPAFSLEEDFDKTQGQLLNSAGMIGAAGAQISGLDWAKDIMQKYSANFGNKRVKPLALSYLSWIRSSTSPFQFTLYKFAVRPEDDVITPFKKLFRCVLPKAANNWVLETPIGYTPPYNNALGTSLPSGNIGGAILGAAAGAMLGGGVKGAVAGALGGYFATADHSKTGHYTPDGNVPGTVTVRIGTWCTIRGLLVSSLSFTGSKSCTKFGNPLYASGTISLVPYRMLIYQDIESMIRHNSSEPDLGSFKPLI